MRGTPLLLVSLFALLQPGDCRLANAEEKLMDDLLNKTRYNNLIRPATSSSQLISIRLELSLSQLISVEAALKMLKPFRDEETGHCEQACFIPVPAPACPCFPLVATV